MEKEAAFPNDFPTDGVELRYFLVVSNYARSLAFYRDVLGATVMHELAGTLCILRFAGARFSCRLRMIPRKTSLPRPIRHLPIARASSAN